MMSSKFAVQDTLSHVLFPLANRLLTWPRMVGVAIYESSDTFPNPLLKDLDNTVSAV